MGSPDQQQKQRADQGEIWEVNRSNFAICYPIIAKRREVQAIKDLISQDRNIEPADDPLNYAIKDVVDKVWQEEMPSEKLLSDEIEEGRREIEEVLEMWAKQITGKEGIVFCPTGLQFRFRGFMIRVKERSNVEDDQFELPQDSYEDAMSLLEKFPGWDPEVVDEKVPIFAPKKEVPLEDDE